MRGGFGGGRGGGGMMGPPVIGRGYGPRSGCLGCLPWGLLIGLVGAIGFSVQRRRVSKNGRGEAWRA